MHPTDCPHVTTLLNCIDRSPSSDLLLNLHKPAYQHIRIISFEPLTTSSYYRDRTAFEIGLEIELEIGLESCN
jgi:hypothetical protein